MRFSKKTKQKVIDDYLASSGKNIFVPDEFVDWLADQPDHEMYDTFYGVDDQVAAKKLEIDLARRMASGLRVVKETIKEKKSGAFNKGCRVPSFYITC